MCTNVLFLKVLYYAMTALQIIRFLVPLGLIAMISIDVYKGMMSADEPKDVIRNSSNRIVAAIVIFVLPTIVNLLVSILENTFSTSLDYQSCLTNASNYKYYEDLEVAILEETNATKREELLKKAQQLKEEEIERINQNKNNVDIGLGDGTVVGRKYDLTEKQLINIAKVCQREQGSPVGAAAEAQLMANKYELEVLKKSKWSKYSFYNYVMNCDWWAPAKNGTYSSTKLKDSILASVREVLINGQRTIPFYINEHDWTGDIIRLKTNGKVYTSSSDFKNTNNYVKDVTRVTTKYNKTSSTPYWIYYYHPTPKSDPFGYTVSAKKQIDNLSK